MDVLRYKKSAKKYWPAIVLERRFGDFGHGLFSLVIFWATIIFGIFSLLAFPTDFLLGTSKIYGAFFLLLSVTLTIEAVVFFHNSYAYSDFELPVMKDNDNLPAVSYEAASFLMESPDADAVWAFVNSPVGKMTVYRLGLSEKDIGSFIKNHPRTVSVADVIAKLGDKDFLNMSQLAAVIVSVNHDFSIFLSSRKITDRNFIGATAFAEHLSKRIRFERRWWSREKLGRISGIGKNWAYGEIPTLNEFSRPINSISYYANAASILSIRKSEVEQLEGILSRIRGANALVVADTNDGAMEIIAALGLMINQGKAMPQIEHRQVFVLDYVTLIGVTKEPSLFEAKIISALKESIKAGNIILVINDLPGLIEAAGKIGSNILDIFDWYFNSPDIHIIATATSHSFHAVIENNSGLMRHLEKVQLKRIDEDTVLNYLMSEVLWIESKTKSWFLYQAIDEAAESAERFFFGQNVENKAADLLIDAATEAKSTGVKIVDREDIMRLVEMKTGIPRQTNSIGTDNSILLNLEQILSKRVVGQEEAIVAVSGAMRRANAGIVNPNRPLGSFLFLGPTGVGKTETTKALADAFFGGESAILRLDMSEYKTADALERLIGNFALGKPGVLSSMLRDRPYGVLLLDEFEKTSKDVIDLFLQILDEGMFSDMSGKRVSARNLIIIATSNAGSALIWNAVKQFGAGGPSLNKDSIINAIISEGIFKPELLNRFDGVIMFHPLTRANLTKIAELMLKKLNKRLSEKGLEVLITPELINVLVEKGTDPTFGARPMNRAIQDKVETFVADKILRHEVLPGTKIVFTPEEIVAIRN